IIGVIDTKFNHPDLSCSSPIPNCSVVKYSDFQSPTCDIHNFSSSCIGGSNHGTAVAGIMIGNGAHAGGPTPVEACRVKGQSFGAGIGAVACGVFRGCFNFCQEGSPPAVIDEIFQTGYDLGSRLSNNSWGSLAPDRYGMKAERVDFWAYNNTGGDPTSG